jgi:hypothetical protein
MPGEAKGVQFSGVVRVGDFVAASAILISGYGIFHSLGEARELTQIELRNHQREAAARAVARLDRWKAVQDSLQTDLQPIIISVTETLRDSRNAVRARDQLWREVISAYAALERRVVSEQLDTGYESLLVYSPESRPIYLSTYNRLQHASKRAVWGIVEDGQRAILALNPRDYPQTHILGNALRDIVLARFRELASSADAVGQGARAHFCRSVAATEEGVASCASTVGNAATEAK